MSRRPGRRASSVVTAVSALLVLLPVVAVAAGVVGADAVSWERVAGSRWPALTLSTMLLVGLTVLGTLVVGGGLAWLTTAYDFPGRAPLAWLLVLPTAVPGYVLGLVWSSLLSYAGPVQTASRAVFGPGFPPVRTLPVAAAVLVLALYPYVYLLARAAVAEQAAVTYGAARTLGLRPWQAARRVVLPLARPALAAGSLLVAVEVLSDFATVSYFGVDTLSVGIFRVWRGQFDRPAASVLALLVLLLALGLVGAERLLRRGARYTAPVGGSRPLERVRLTGGQAAAATGACLSVLGLAVVVPVATLLVWSSTTPFQDSGFVTAAINSVLLAVQVAAVVVVVGLLVVHAARVDGRRRVRFAVQATLFGYAVPGPVLAIGALLVLAALRNALDALGLPGGGALVNGSVAALVVVYALRFLALGYTTLDARLSAVSPQLTSAALSLGAAPRRVLTAVHLPLARSGVAVAAVLVAVDALKELPIVLLLRPFGFDTLAVRVWQLAADSRYEVAGLPALCIVLTAMIPVVLLFRAPDGAPADAAHPHGDTTVPSADRPSVPA